MILKPLICNNFRNREDGIRGGLRAWFLEFTATSDEGGKNVCTVGPRSFSGQEKC